MKNFIKYFTESVDPLVNAKRDYNRTQTIGCRDLSGSLKKTPMAKVINGNSLVANFRTN